VDDDYQPSEELRAAIAKFQTVEGKRYFYDCMDWVPNFVVKREENPKKNRVSFGVHDGQFL
jgi:hypothetical protein